jgi:mono/diheme cytochrome c family protein
MSAQDGFSAAVAQDCRCGRRGKSDFFMAGGSNCASRKLSLSGKTTTIPIFFRGFFFLRSSSLVLHLAAAATACACTCAGAQTAPIAENASAGKATHTYPAPTNLKILPKDMTGAEVHELMEQWTDELGVDCANCHTRDAKEVAPNGKPKLNYADDSKEEKNTARVMYKMVESINVDFVSTVPNSGVPVDCGTCHRGQKSPELFKAGDKDTKLASAAPAAAPAAAAVAPAAAAAAPAANAGEAMSHGAGNGGAGHAGALDPGSKDYYQARIEPILKENCTECHNDEKLKGGLLMDSYTTLMQGGDDGYVIVPGDPDGSMLIQGIRRVGDMKPMPPKAVLDPASVDAVVAWVKAGAKGPDAPVARK